MEQTVPLEKIYATSNLTTYQARIDGLAKEFQQEFSSTGDQLSAFSVAGRIEVGGNHTDHQLGKVICATIHLDTLAMVEPRNDGVISVKSEGYPLVTLNISDTALVKAEENTTPALIRGVCHKLKEMGHTLGGFNALVTSNVLKGSGMSSSASFEGMIGVIMNELYCGGKVSLVELAKIGQFAENVYFGKPSGLMDQIACILGGFCFIDFYDPENPKIEQVDSTLLSSQYDVCIMDTGDSHDDLTAEYAAVPGEMGEIAEYFGETYLSRVSEEKFYQSLAELKGKFGDRSILRAMHFFQETELAQKEYEALKAGKLDEFLSLVRQSGRSSVEKLQNIYDCHQPQVQGANIILALCQRFLGEVGGYRIHGGGFGGTVQAFVPKSQTALFKEAIEAVMGEGTCHVVSVRSGAGCKL